MAHLLPKETLQIAARDPAQLLLPLVPPATASLAGHKGRQVPSAAADALAPPLHNLPGGKLKGPRTIFERADSTPWVARSHTFPAAWPRAMPTAVAPAGLPIPPPGLSKEAAAKAWDTVRPSVLEAAVGPLSTSQTAHENLLHERIKALERQLWCVVERIVPTQKRSAQAGTQHVTLVMAHANGLHKETFEPFLQSLLTQLPSDIVVDDIWSLDTINMGEAALLNRHGIGAGLMFWPDLARDVLQFLKHYLPATPPESQVGDMLPRASEGALPPRTVLIGHSFGAAVMGLVANAHPELVDTLVIMDPPLNHPPVFSTEGLPPLFGPDGEEVPRGIEVGGTDPDHAQDDGDHVLMALAARRRDMWPSRETAAKIMSKSPFYGAWSTKAQKLFFEHALAPVPRPNGKIPSHREESEEDPVTLSTPKYSEAATFGGVVGGAYISSALLSGNFARYWEQHRNEGGCKGHTFLACATELSTNALLASYYEHMRVLEAGQGNSTVLEEQRAQGEQLRSLLLNVGAPGLPTDSIAGWEELHKRFHIKGEATVFDDSAHMLPQIQPDNVAAVVSGWMKETISKKPDAHL